MENTIMIKRTLWTSVVKELRRRGGGKRESGAFLLAQLDTHEIVDVKYYDDLSPGCLDSGMVIFKGAGYTDLWQYCKQNGLTVIADVHTHPRRWTGQSEADRTNPMIAQSGHRAFIVPNYAQKRRDSLKGISAYLYLGSHNWKKYDNINDAINII